MKFFALYCCLLCCYVPLCMGQHLSNATQFKGAKNAAYAIATDPMGSTYTAGLLYGRVSLYPSGQGGYELGGGDGNVYLQKMDKDGKFIWTQSFGDLTKRNEVGDMAVDKEGNVYVVGTFQEKMHVDRLRMGQAVEAAGEKAAYVIKYNTWGKLAWVKVFESAEGWAKGHAIAVDQQGGVYVAGEFKATMNIGETQQQLECEGTNNGFVVKLDSKGAILWTQKVATGFISAAQYLAVDAKGNVGVAGTYRREARFGKQVEQVAGPLLRNAFLLHLSPEGTMNWVKTIQEEAGNRAMELAVDYQGNFVLVVISSIFPSVKNPNIDKAITTIQLHSYDAKGNTRWQQKFNDNTIIKDLAFDTQDNLYVVGHFSNQITSSTLKDFQPLQATGERDAFVIKLDASNKVVDAYNIGGKEENVALLQAVAVRSENDYILAGDFKGTIDADFGEEEYTLVSSETFNTMVLQVSPVAKRLFPTIEQSKPTTFQLVKQKEYSVVLNRLVFDASKGVLPQFYSAEKLDLEAVRQTEPIAVADVDMEEEIVEEEIVEEEVVEEVVVEEAPSNTKKEPTEFVYNAKDQLILPIQADERVLTLDAKRIIVKKDKDKQTYILKKYTLDGQFVKQIESVSESKFYNDVRTVGNDQATYFHHASTGWMDNKKGEEVIFYNDNLEEVFRYVYKDGREMSLVLKGKDQLILVESVRDQWEVFVGIYNLSTKEAVLEKTIATKPFKIQPSSVHHQLINDNIYLVINNYTSNIALLYGIDQQGNSILTPNIIKGSIRTSQGGAWPEQNLIFLDRYSSALLYSTQTSDLVSTTTGISPFNLQVTASGDYLCAVKRMDEEDMGAYIYNNYQLYVTNGKEWKYMRLPKDMMVSRALLYPLQDNLIAIHLDQYLLIYDVSFEKARD